MLGIRLLEFIGQLRSNEFLAERDQSLLKRFDEQFSSLKPDDMLSVAQLQFIQQVFSERFRKIVDTEDDYTFNSRGHNEYWVIFSHHLADAMGKSFLQILMPSVTNAVDPNNFAKHVDDRELSHFFLGEDGKTLYNINGFLDHLHKKQSFSTYNTYKENRKYTPRLLSVRELLRIRSKRHAPAIEVCGESFDSVWECLTRRVFPELQKTGELPRQLLPLLLELVDFYFAERSKIDFQRNFLQIIFSFSKHLQECSIDDANCLYGQKIHVGETTHYLLNILLDCVQGDHTTMPSKMEGIARWICQYDASLTGKSLELGPLYAALNVGRSFKVSQLQDHLKLLHENSSIEVQRDLISLSEIIFNKTEIDPETVAGLADIYRTRWLQIQGKAEDYTRMQRGSNALWIRLAQLLESAGFTQRNYYCFLMPTLQADVDPIQKLPVTEFPLSHYVLSANGRYLIYLGNCEQHYKVAGTFNNCNTKPPSPLNEVELGRLSFASERYHRYIKHARCGDEYDLPISKDTVLAVYNLVNESLYPVGLQWARNYDETQVTLAERSFSHFCVLLNKLPQDERDRLLAQRIIFKGKNLSFKSILEDVQSEECVASCLQLMAKLVMDYAPYLRFRSDLETKFVETDDMRAQSRKKVFRNYSFLDDKEAKRRIQILAVSLMSYGFQFPMFGESLSIWDCSNTMGEEPKKIYQLIRPMICSGLYKDARHIYATLMESAVNPALVDRETSLLIWLTRPNATQRWLESVASCTLFTQKNAWFQPGLLLATLLPIPIIDSVTSRLLEGFFDEFLHTYAQPQNNALKEIRINIQFMQFLNSLADTPRRQILKLIELPHQQDDDNKGFCRMYGNVLIHRLASLGAHALAPQGRFFSTSPSGDKVTHQLIKEINASLGGSKGAENGSVQGLFENLNTGIEKIGNERAVFSMKMYLRKIMSPISPLIRAESLSVAGPLFAAM